MEISKIRAVKKYSTNYSNFYWNTLNYANCLILILIYFLFYLLLVFYNTNISTIYIFIKLNIEKEKLCLNYILIEFQKT